MTQTSLSSRRGTLLLVAMTVSTYLIVTVEALTNGLLTLLATDLNTTTSNIGLLATAYAGVVVVTTVPGALLLRNVPRRWVLAGSLALIVGAVLWGGLATGYPMLLAARMVTAIGQAQFWVAALPGTAGLFPVLKRGRVLALLALGNSLSPVFGIPVAAWIAERFTWRAAFFAVSALAALVMLAVVALFPTVKPSESGAATAPHPSQRRVTYQLAAVILLVTGSFGLLVFMTQVLRDMGGWSQEDMPLLLLVQGCAAVAGALLVSRFIDRHGWRYLVLATIVLIAALMVIFVAGTNRFVTIASIAVFVGAFAGLPPIFTHRIMQVATGSVSTAVAIQASLFNVGIAGGSALGSVITAEAGVRWVMLAGAGLVTLGLAVVVLEHFANPPLPLAGRVAH